MHMTQNGAFWVTYARAVVSREHGWNSVRSMRYPAGIPEDDPPVTARGPLRRATARALLGEMAGLLRRVFRFLGLVLEEFRLCRKFSFDSI